jgi:hypothetical protein
MLAGYNFIFGDKGFLTNYDGRNPSFFDNQFFLSITKITNTRSQNLTKYTALLERKLVIYCIR